MLASASRRSLISSSEGVHVSQTRASRTCPSPMRADVLPTCAQHALVRVKSQETTKWPAATFVLSSSSLPSPKGYCLARSKVAELLLIACLPQQASSHWLRGSDLHQSHIMASARSNSGRSWCVVWPCVITSDFSSDSKSPSGRGIRPKTLSNGERPLLYVEQFNEKAAAMIAEFKASLEVMEWWSTRRSTSLLMSFANPPVLFSWYHLIKGSLVGETSVLRTFRMSGKELVKERVSQRKR